MKNIKNRYLALIVISIVLPIFLWLLSFPSTTIKHNAFPISIYSSQLFAIIGFSLFAISFVLSTRIKWIEKYFGGLDKLYHKHHTVGKIAFFLLLFHPILLALRWIPNNLNKFFWYLLPVHRKLEIDLGAWSLVGLTVLILLTILIKIPYDKWKITHKFMGLFFVLGILHVFLIRNFFANNTLLAIYLIIISSFGLAAFIYKTILHKWVVKTHSFNVERIQKLSEKVMEITLSTPSNDFDYKAGQFCFFQFDQVGISKESHPFTICGASKAGHITILVKSLGDFTNNLCKKLTLNTPVLVEGPYGYFDYKQGKQKQIWIAGGVGIAPFVSFSRDFKTHFNPDLEIDFYYCVNNETEAFHLYEFEQLEKTMPNFHIKLLCSDTSGFIKGNEIENVKDRTIFICGPKELRTILLKHFKTLPIDKDDIIFEDFDFI